MGTASLVTGGGLVVIVEGKRVSAALELLRSLGMPKKWIAVLEMADRKRSKVKCHVSMLLNNFK